MDSLEMISRENDGCQVNERRKPGWDAHGQPDRVSIELTETTKKDDSPVFSLSWASGGASGVFLASLLIISIDETIP